MAEEKNFTTSKHVRHAPLSLAQECLPPMDAALRSVAIFQHGSLLLKLYSPQRVDRQTPHTRDELYIVAHGSGIFVNGEARHSFTPGDALFVPAGVTHRFESFSDDFEVWVMFYGPEGGEKA